MSTTTATSGNSASGSSQAGAAKASSGSSQRTDKTAQTPADLFASLLGLLSATRDAGLPADGAEPTALETAAQADLIESDNAPAPGDNPLAALLSWPGAPVLQADLPGPGGAALEPGGTETANLTPDTPLNGKPDPLTAAASGPSHATASGAGSDAADLQGMTLLDQPVQADAELQASLEATTHSTGAPRPNAGSATRADASALASRPASWRSTTALAHHNSHGALSTTATSTTNQIQQGQAAQVRVMADTGLPASRSTLTLDERFSTSSQNEGSSPLAAFGAHGQAASHGGSDPSSSGGGAFAEALNTERPENDTSESDFTLAPETPEDAALQEEAALSPQQLRYASLRIGEGSDEAIDIQLALRGEQLNVDFRTDNPEARAGLQQNATGTLADLLQRGGIQLGQVSVGAQSQGQERQGNASPRSMVSSPARRSGTAGLDLAGSDALRAQPTPRRQDGSRPLDLFV